MSRFKIPAPSPALVISLVALFVSLGGVSYAVATGSIDSREIKNNTVRTGDIRNNTITGRDIRTATITSGDVRNDTLLGRDILESSLGAVPTATRATTAANVTGFVHGAAAQTDGGADKDLFSLNGFRVFLRCTGGASSVFLENTSAGANGSADTDDASGDDADFDQADAVRISTVTDGSNASGRFTAFGSKGSITGLVGVGDSVGGTATCQANGSATG
jgi:hypothetical protein